jgi:hypothetical protein
MYQRLPKGIGYDKTEARPEDEGSGQWEVLRTDVLRQAKYVNAFGVVWHALSYHTQGGTTQQKGGRWRPPSS